MECKVQDWSKDWSNQTALGRMEAAHDLAAVRQTDNMLLLIRKIRAAAADPAGFGVGYLSALAQAATR
ncbi:hypothetical protein PANO111632_02375 [Paracoccus nototheniae]